ncbi:MAG: hypothetical protein IJC64_00585 [Clostridia bacterium]|nr:hypothetical protein [Clostridia bacterium]
MSKKILIGGLVVAAAGAAAAGFIVNSKQMRMKRMLARAGKAMFVVGTMLRNLSCQTME